jgi:hypothetical protein
VVYANLDWTLGNQSIVRVPRGATLLRVHFGWGFYGDTTTTADLQAVSQNIQVMGICTTVGDGSETPPEARVEPYDVAPPTERWVYWESRAPKLAAYSATDQLVFWQDSGAQEPADTKGMVSAKSIAEGSTLGVWASWQSANPWDPTGNVDLWFYASALYS